MKEAINNRMVRAWWFLSNNVGDSINEVIIREFSKREIVASVDKSEPHFIVCGSILSHANKNSIVWGAGFGYEHHRKSDLYGCENIVSVRGDLSAERTEMDIKAIGDPALLMPQIYSGYKDLLHGVGLIPHWANVERAVEQYGDRYIISPLLPFDKFIDEILSCEFIFSESLHGLILADAYGVPNAWIDMGGVEEKFKYSDYYSTTTTPAMKPIKEIDIKSCQVHTYKYNLETLLNSCPFLWT
jgi:pyruvyltransferase